MNEGRYGPTLKIELTGQRLQIFVRQTRDVIHSFIDQLSIMKLSHSIIC